MTEPDPPRREPTPELPMAEPGLDLHEWESEWADLDEAAADAPEETLPEMVRVIEEMLEARGFELREPTTVEGEEPEIVRSFFAARELARLIDQGDDDIAPEDIADAIDDLRAIFDYLVVDRSAP